MEMGFDEKEVIDALRVNNNQQDAAVSKYIKTAISETYKVPVRNNNRTGILT